MARKSVFVLLAAVLAAIPQVIYAGWARTYGGDNYDYAWSVQQTNDGNYIVVGGTRSFGAGDADCWLLKVNDKGDTLWTRTYGDSKSDVGCCVQQTSDGGYIITGLKTSVKEGDENVWLFKTDSQEELVWEKCYGEENHDYGYCVQETSNGGYIVAGVRDIPKSGCGCPRAWLLKTNSLGDTLWTRSYGSIEASGRGYHVLETSDGGYVLVGELFPDLLLLKVNSDGDSLWSHTYSRGDYQHPGLCIQETQDGGFIITGGSIDDKQRSKVWLLKTDSLGDTLWTRTYGGEKFDMGDYVTPTSDGGYIITGLKDYVGPGWGDLYLLKTDSEGYEEWNRIYGKTGIDVETDEGSCVRQTSDGGYIIAGYTESYGAGAYDLWLIKTDSFGLVDAVEEEPPVTPVTHQPDWQLTPIGPQIVLRYTDRPEGLHASVFDASGRKVDVIHSAGASGTITWGEGQTSGVYFIKVEAETPSCTLKVVLIN